MQNKKLFFAIFLLSILFFTSFFIGAKTTIAACAAPNVVISSDGSYTNTDPFIFELPGSFNLYAYYGPYGTGYGGTVFCKFLGPYNFGTGEGTMCTPGTTARYGPYSNLVSASYAGSTLLPAAGTYTQNFTYLVKGASYNYGDGGCATDTTFTFSRSFVVYPALNVSIASNSISSGGFILAGTTLNFTGNVSGGNGNYAYVWTPVGSNTSGSTTNSFTTTFNTSGTYTVTLSVNDGLKSAVNQFTVYVASASMTANSVAIPNNGSVDLGDTLTLSVTGSSGRPTWSGNVQSLSSCNYTTYATPCNGDTATLGSKSVTAVFNGLTYIFNFNVVPVPTAVLTTSQGGRTVSNGGWVAINTPVNFSIAVNDGVAPFTYTWPTGWGCTNNTCSHTFASTGSQSGTVTAKDTTNHSVLGSFNFTAYIVPLDPPTITVKKSGTSIPSGTKVSASDSLAVYTDNYNGQPFNSYAWTSNTANSYFSAPTGYSSAIKPRPNASSNISLSVTDGEPLTKTGSFNLNVFGTNISVSQGGKSFTPCIATLSTPGTANAFGVAGTVVNLGTSAVGGISPYTYTWTGCTANADSSGCTFTPATVGGATKTLVIKDSNSPQLSDTEKISFYTTPSINSCTAAVDGTDAACSPGNYNPGQYSPSPACSPSPWPSYSFDFIAEMGKPVVLSVTPGGAASYTYSWSGGNNSSTTNTYTETFLTVGTKNIKVTVNASGYMSTMTFNITVGKAVPEIDWSSPIGITYGTKLGTDQLNATASYNGQNVPGDFTYTPAAGTILGAGTQTLVVNFAPTDTDTYMPADAQVTINVDKADATIKVNGYNVNYDGTPHTSTGTATGINADGLPEQLTGINLSGTTHTQVGSWNDNWTFTAPNGNYNNDAGTVQDVIFAASKVTPIIVWNNPADISAGTALGSTQLNARAQVNGSAIGGTYTYTPASGTVLSVGNNQVLSVHFVPSDATNYNAADGSVSVNVVNRITSINFTEDPIYILVGDSHNVTPVIAPSNASNQSLTWETEDSTIATVNNNGLVTGVKVGNTQLKATANDGSGTFHVATVHIITPPTIDHINAYYQGQAIALDKPFPLQYSKYLDFFAEDANGNAGAIGGSGSYTYTWEINRTADIAYPNGNSANFDFAGGPGTAVVSVYVEDSSGHVSDPIPFAISLLDDHPSIKNIGRMGKTSWPAYKTSLDDNNGFGFVKVPLYAATMDTTVTVDKNSSYSAEVTFYANDGIGAEGGIPPYTYTWNSSSSYDVMPFDCSHSASCKFLLNATNTTDANGNHPTGLGPRMIWVSVKDSWGIECENFYIPYPGFTKYNQISNDPPTDYVTASDNESGYYVQYIRNLVCYGGDCSKSQMGTAYYDGSSGLCPSEGVNISLATPTPSVTCSASLEGSDSGKDTIVWESAADSGTPPYTYSWRDSAGYTSTHDSYFQEYNSGVYNSTITVTDVYNKTASCTASIDTRTPFTVECTPAEQTIKTGTSGSVSATVSGGATPYRNYTWSGPVKCKLGDPDCATNILYCDHTDGTPCKNTDIFVTAFDSSNPSQQKHSPDPCTIYITPKKTPGGPLTLGKCTADPTSGYTPLKVTFIPGDKTGLGVPNGGTGAYTYEWTGACTGNSANCVKTFINDSALSVKEESSLRVCDINGCTPPVTCSASVMTLPVSLGGCYTYKTSDATKTPVTTVVSGTPVTFVPVGLSGGTGSANYEYDWSDDDSNSGSDILFPVTYDETSAVTHFATLAVTDGLNLTSATATCPLSITPLPTTYCGSDGVCRVSDSTNPADGSFCAVANNVNGHNNSCLRCETDDSNSFTGKCIYGSYDQSGCILGTDTTHCNPDSQTYTYCDDSGMCKATTDESIADQSGCVVTDNVRSGSVSHNAKCVHCARNNGELTGQCVYGAFEDSCTVGTDLTNCPLNQYTYCDSDGVCQVTADSNLAGADCSPSSKLVGNRFSNGCAFTSCDDTGKCVLTTDSSKENPCVLAGNDASGHNPICQHCQEYASGANTGSCAYGQYQDFNKTTCSSSTCPPGKFTRCFSGTCIESTNPADEDNSNCSAAANYQYTGLNNSCMHAYCTSAGKCEYTPDESIMADPCDPGSNDQDGHNPVCSHCDTTLEGLFTGYCTYGTYEADSCSNADTTKRNASDCIKDTSTYCEAGVCKIDTDSTHANDNCAISKNGTDAGTGLNPGCEYTYCVASGLNVGKCVSTTVKTSGDESDCAVASNVNGKNPKCQHCQLANGQVNGKCEYGSYQDFGENTCSSASCIPGKCTTDGKCSTTGTGSDCNNDADCNFCTGNTCAPGSGSSLTPKCTTATQSKDCATCNYTTAQCGAFGKDAFGTYSYCSGNAACAECTKNSQCEACQTCNTKTGLCEGGCSNNQTCCTNGKCADSVSGCPTGKCTSDGKCSLSGTGIGCASDTDCRFCTGNTCTPSDGLSGSPKCTTATQSKDCATCNYTTAQCGAFGKDAFGTYSYCSGNAACAECTKNSQCEACQTCNTKTGLCEGGCSGNQVCCDSGTCASSATGCPTTHCTSDGKCSLSGTGVGCSKDTDCKFCIGNTCTPSNGLSDTPKCSSNSACATCDTLTNQCGVFGGDAYGNYEYCQSGLQCGACQNSKDCSSCQTCNTKTGKCEDDCPGQICCDDGSCTDSIDKCPTTHCTSDGKCSLSGTGIGCTDTVNNTDCNFCSNLNACVPGDGSSGTPVCSVLTASTDCATCSTITHQCGGFGGDDYCQSKLQCGACTKNSQCDSCQTCNTTTGLCENTCSGNQVCCDDGSCADTESACPSTHCTAEGKCSLSGTGIGCNTDTDCNFCSNLNTCTPGTGLSGAPQCFVYSESADCATCDTSTNQCGVFGGNAWCQSGLECGSCQVDSECGSCQTCNTTTGVCQNDCSANQVCCDNGSCAATEDACQPVTCVGACCQCTGPNCACVGADCPCVGQGCTCTGSNCDCTGPNCACSGVDCNIDKSSANCSSCSGANCPCTGPTCDCTIAGHCGCIGPNCDCTGPNCGGCTGLNCSCSQYASGVSTLNSCSCTGPYCYCSGTGCESNAPEVGTISAPNQDHCSAAGAETVFLSWTYSASNANPQSGFQIQISTGSGFATDSLVYDKTVSGQANSRYVTVSKDPTECSADEPCLEFNKTYYWRAKVLDEKLGSDWKNGLAFSTPNHPYPAPNFTAPSTSTPFINNHADVIFSDISVCFSNIGGNIIAIPCNKKGINYLWNFDYHANNPIYPSSTSKGDVVYTYRVKSSKQVMLTVTDTSLANPATGDTGSCSSSIQKISIGSALNIPQWREVSPF